MFKIVYGGFCQETNTFSPTICTMEHFMAHGSCEGEEIIHKYYAASIPASSMIKCLVDAPDVTVIPTALYNAQSCGRVDQAVADLFIEKICGVIEASKPLDAVFLTLHGGMCLTEEDDGIGYILEHIRKVTGPECLIVASTDLHANITHKVMQHLDILTGYHEYPHTDSYHTGTRAATLGLDALRTGKRPAMACAKIPMILQAEACTTKEGPLYELIQQAEAWQEEGKFLDFSPYHMQPWLDCKEAGASIVVIAEEAEAAKYYADEIAARFFALRNILQYRPMTLDEGLDLAVSRPTGELIVLSDAADNTSGGATGDSVVVLRRILERELDIRAACVVVDPVAVEEAIALGEGAVAEFTIGGKLDPARQQPVTFTARVAKICNPVVTETFGGWIGATLSFGKVAILRVRNTDVILCVYPQMNTSPSQFTGFGLDLSEYDMVLVKSSLAYKGLFKHFTSQMHNIDTPGSTSSDLISLGFTRIPRPMFPFDKGDDFGPEPAYLART